MTCSMFQTYEVPAGRQDTAERVARLREVIAAAQRRRGAGSACRRIHERVRAAVRAAAHLAHRLYRARQGWRWWRARPPRCSSTGATSCRRPSRWTPTIFEILQIPAAKLAGLDRQAPEGGAVVGFDPWLHTPAIDRRAGEGTRKQAHQAEGAGAAIRSTACGAGSGPAPPQGAVVPHPLKYAGKSAEEKLKELQAELKKDGQDAVVLTCPNSICWLFNIRGSDVAHNPVVLAFAIVPASGKPELFIDPAKIGPEAKAHLAPLAKISEPQRWSRGSRALKQAGEDACASAPRRRVWFTRKLKGGKARVVAGHRSLHAAEGAQERDRDQGRARCAQARRCRDGALPGLARPRGGNGRPRRDRRRAEARDDPQRDAGAEGDQLRYHLRLGAERRHRALSGDGCDQPQARSRASFISSIPARSISTAPRM